MSKLSSKELLYGYYNGIFPMADNDGEIFWYSPEQRAIIPLDKVRFQKSLRPIINQRKFEVRIDTDFEGVMSACAAPRKDENETWISQEIIAAYVELSKMKLAHSVEVYQNGKLVGGLYGVAIGGVFFGESMFHTVSNSSKVAFYYLVEILKHNKFQLLDSQFINDNVARFGAIEIPRDEFLKKLKTYLKLPLTFDASFLEKLNLKKV